MVLDSQGKLIKISWCNMNYLKICSIIIVTLIGCKAQTVDNNLFEKLLSSKHCLLITELENSSQFVGKLVLWDYESNERVIIDSNFPKVLTAKISNNREFLCIGPEPMADGKIFTFINLLDKKVQKVDLTSQLPNDRSFQYVATFDFVNDSTIVFGYSENIYSYSMKEDKLKILLELKDKRIDGISFNSNKHVYAFSYQEGFKSLGTTKYGIFDERNNTLQLFEQSTGILSNWSADNNKLFFYHDEILMFFNLAQKSFKKASKQDIILDKGVFISNDMLIVRGAKFDEGNENQLYLFDVNKDQIIKKIYDNNSYITNLSVLKN